MATKRRVTPIQGKKAIAVTKEGDFYTVEQAAKILKLQRQLDEARRPWWRKMFGG
jgi:ribosomal protein L28